MTEARTAIAQKVLDDYLNLGMDLREAKEYEEACEILGRAVERAPGSDAAHLALGLSLLDAERYEEAVAALRTAAELALPDAPKTAAAAYFSLGLAYRSMDEDEAMLKAFDTAIALAPQHREAHQGKVRALLKLGKLEEALVELDRALALGPDQVWSLQSRGETYRLMERYDEALADFTRALELKPDYEWAVALRGETYRRMERYDEALADFTRALELRPDDEGVLTSRGETYRLMERYDEALADFTRALELKPDNAEAYYNKACILAVTGQATEACAWLEKAIGMEEKFRRMSREDSDFDAIQEEEAFRALVWAGEDGG